ncbi:hypothetical protein C8F01DRAFT_1233266 [Mycena amicta]|nr:hypothetical protein C8F01DRAFT_1233266 [Mycena amicta]
MALSLPSLPLNSHRRSPASPSTSTTQTPPAHPQARRQDRATFLGQVFECVPSFLLKTLADDFRASLAWYASARPTTSTNLDQSLTTTSMRNTRPVRSISAQSVATAPTGIPPLPSPPSSECSATACNQLIGDLSGLAGKPSHSQSHTVTSEPTVMLDSDVLSFSGRKVIFTTSNMIANDVTPSTSESPRPKIPSPILSPRGEDSSLIRQKKLLRFHEYTDNCANDVPGASAQAIRMSSRWLRDFLLATGCAAVASGASWACGVKELLLGVEIPNGTPSKTRIYCGKQSTELIASLMPGGRVLNPGIPHLDEQAKRTSLVWSKDGNVVLGLGRKVAVVGAVPSKIGVCADKTWPSTSATGVCINNARSGDARAPGSPYSTVSLGVNVIPQLKLDHFSESEYQSREAGRPTDGASMMRPIRLAPWLPAPRHCFRTITRSRSSCFLSCALTPRAVSLSPLQSFIFVSQVRLSNHARIADARTWDDGRAEADKRANGGEDGVGGLPVKRALEPRESELDSLEQVHSPSSMFLKLSASHLLSTAISSIEPVKLIQAPRDRKTLKLHPIRPHIETRASAQARFTAILSRLSRSRPPSAQAQFTSTALPPLRPQLQKIARYLRWGSRRATRALSDMTTDDGRWRDKGANRETRVDSDECRDNCECIRLYPILCRSDAVKVHVREVSNTRVRPRLRHLFQHRYARTAIWIRQEEAWGVCKYPASQGCIRSEGKQ